MRAPQGPPVLAAGDLTATSDYAAWRAALVARDLRAPLRLLQPASASAARAAAFARLASDIQHRVGVHAQVTVLAGDLLQETVRAARDAQMLVIATGRCNPLRAFILGTQAERLIRLCRTPVLVVKRPARGSYRRVLVPVDLGVDARSVIAAASRLSRDPRMEVLHALDTRGEMTLRVSDVSEAVLRRQRDGLAAQARAALVELIAAAGALDAGAMPAISFGDAATTVLTREQALRADLVVIGKRTRGLLADFFLGGVTQRVLMSAKADVLVLPRAARRAKGEAWPAGARLPV